jgi:hypothetical protein
MPAMRDRAGSRLPARAAIPVRHADPIFDSRDRTGNHFDAA